MSQGLDAERRERLKVLFDQAQEVPAESRHRWLDEACGADSGLRRELESLLSALDQAQGFLEAPAFASTGAAMAVLAEADVHPACDLVGRSFGPYRILRELGRGGMGVVYLGARDDEAFEKLVAVKVVQGVHLQPALRQRFHEERRILAALDHPNIARLLDAGTTPDGLPYVVMEYVEGVPIDRHCQTRALPTRARLELFLAVCAAVQYSHQRLVVHRDIKAGNVLVDLGGAPKLLDFGIAKMLAPGREGGGTTRTVLRALTPDSASPEQVRGEPVTVSSDVYSLGVLLYRLLTERSPYASRPSSELDLLRAICEEQPLRPSEAVSSVPNPEGDGARGAARRLRRELAGDVDLIVLQALRKEPERRYASVEQLANDVERHLAGLPVRAATDSWTYRTRKFLRRHRLAVGMAAAAAIAVLGAATISLQQARIARRERAVAEQRFDMVRRLAHAVVFELDDALEPVPGAISARKLMVARAIDYLDSLSLQQPKDPALLRELADAYLRIGGIQGDPSRPNLGDAAGALDSYGHALQLYGRLIALDTGPETRAGLATVHRALGIQLWARGEAAEARTHFAEALRLYTALSQADPGSPTHRLHLADIHYNLGQVELKRGNPRGAAAAYARALHLYVGLVAEGRTDLSARRGLALTYLKLGDAVLPDRAEALARYRQAAAILDELARLPSARPDARRLAAYAALRIAELLTDSSPAEAAAFATRAIGDLEPAAADPANAQGRGDLAYAWSTLGAARQRQGREREAVSALTRCARLLEARLAANPSSTEDRRILGITRMELGEISFRRGDAPAALRSYEAARRALEAADVRPGALRPLAELFADFGAAAAAAGGLGHEPGPSDHPRAGRQAARDWFRRSAALWSELSAQRPLAADEAAALRQADRAARGPVDRTAITH